MRLRGGIPPRFCEDCHFKEVVSTFFLKNVILNGLAVCPIFDSRITGGGANGGGAAILRRIDVTVGRWRGDGGAMAHAEETPRREGLEETNGAGSEKRCELSESMRECSTLSFNYQDISLVSLWYFERKQIPRRPPRGAAVSNKSPAGPRDDSEKARARQLEGKNLSARFCEIVSRETVSNEQGRGPRDLAAAGRFEMALVLSPWSSASRRGRPSPRRRYFRSNRRPHLRARSWG